ncbi:MAG: signal recognition particle-docking protein FtsY [Nevskiales bacterium]
MSAPSDRSSFVQRLRSRLNRGDSWLTYDLANLLSAHGIDEHLLEELENRLLLADVGVETSADLVQGLRAQVRKGQLKNEQDVRQALSEGLLKILVPCSKPLAIPDYIRPYVILMVGVNGVGKTTTIGKLGQRFQAQGLKVMLAAGDTFRAAAVEQLRVWGERHGVPVIAQGAGADPASVIFDAWQAAKARDMDVLIADTAGRLHTQHNLMEELKKVKRVLQKHDAYAPHEVMLVVDATTGGNALNQAVQFHAAVGLTGLTLTKLDGSAKGGVVLALAKRLALPIRFIGVGETAADLGEFQAEDFVDALLDAP